jgi:hypothetical protein
VGYRPFRIVTALQRNPHRPLTVAEQERRQRLEAYLDTCSEDALIEEVLLPLLRQLGFHRITAAGHKHKAQWRVPDTESTRI